LTREAGESSRLKQQIDEASSFGDLLDLLSKSDNLGISPSKFVGLYLSLPKANRDSVIAAKELLNLYYASDWRRTTIKSALNGAVAYLIDSQNQVMRTVPLPEGHVRVVGDFGRVIKSSLEAMPMFTGRIYPSERFFAILFNLSEAERLQLFPDPGMLLSIPKPVMQVGLGVIFKDGFAVIGIQSSSATGPMVTLYPISNAAYDRLTFLLAWQGSDTLFTPPDTAKPKIAPTPARRPL
jgi:hypothetical protein